MIKRTCLFVAVLLFAGCNFQNITFTGTAPGMDGYTISIVSGRHKTLFGANIKDGKFEIIQQVLEQPGYYTLVVTPPGNLGKIYGVYLEPGKYNIALDSGNHIYPRITSTSSTQNDLTVYRRFTDSINSGIRAEAEKWLNKMNDPKAVLLPDKEYQDIVAKVKSSQEIADNATVTTLTAFVAKHPNNTAIAHAMLNMNFESDPARFLAIYQKVGDNVKNSNEGKEIGDKLKTLNKLAPGSMAPGFVGETPDGKKINVQDLHKKLIIVAFWRSGSGQMAQEQYGLAHTVLQPADTSKVGIISVSFDTDRNSWLAAIKNSGLTHVQISDLKGDDSPNAKNWDTFFLPNYYILDGNGKVLYNNLSYQALSLTVEQELAKH